ncbi:prolyl 4-hydroxylase subunit alpha-2-like [Daphnia pulex]|uniref:prolyl 4-hydroxylase subunit alpha-2-like n=1 Tax=Daphnia pulex TaxID=6669 RepID=UPI001EDF10D8|nr:prolyl 4-hydroxylase subunit alpha-2-like [Daphnia pulex]XP_046453825.1 prolyl 4-hydroxylase subunit alpha-2-like [Daphnia pulex]
MKPPVIAIWLFVFGCVGAIPASNIVVEKPEIDDIFSSVSKMEALVSQENAIVNMLDSFLIDAKQRISIIQNYVTTYRQVMSGDLSSSKLVANPVDAYHLLKRLTIDWDVVERVLEAESNSSRNALNHVLVLRETSVFPNSEDLHGAAIALVRLQDTYQLNVTDLADGHYNGVDHSKGQVFQSRRDLSGRDCLFMAQHAFADGYYDTALQWAEAALGQFARKGDNYGSELETFRNEVKHFVEFASRVHDDVLERQGPRGVNWQTNSHPVDRQFRSGTSEKYDSLAEQQFTPKLYQHQSEDEENEHYERLCRGEKLRSANIEAGLRCRLVTRGHPALLLQPIKVEEQSLDPMIVVLHDLITERQTEILRQLGEPKLATSLHRGGEGKFVRSMIRTSKNAWLQEHENASLPAIRHRMELATGLIYGPETASEYFQIANYGIGGLYKTHTDNVIHPDVRPEDQDPWNLYVGDRIATLMVYLSDVEAGGATVFPRAGVTCWPRKGSAAFWWNLYKSGEPDLTTRHGACPVLHGSKWVSNKWIRQYDQMFVAKCGLHPLEKYDSLLM